MISENQVFDVLHEISGSAKTFPTIDRTPRPIKEISEEDIVLGAMFPKKAANLLKHPDEVFKSLAPELAPVKEKVVQAHTLAKSIDEVTKPAAVKILWPLLSNINHRIPHRPREQSGADELEWSLGILALHKILQLIDHDKDPSELGGSVEFYIEAVQDAQIGLDQIDILAQEIPVLQEDSTVVMREGKQWKGQRKVFGYINKKKEVQGIPLSTYLGLATKLKKGLDLSAMWDKEGLPNNNIPTVTISADQILTLARFYAWAEWESYGPSSPELTPQENQLEYKVFRKKRDLFLSLADQLKGKDKERVRIELATIENALFEDDDR